MLESKHQSVSRPLSSYEPREIDWLWQSRIPRGCVTLLEGNGGTGKSSVIAALGSAVSVGRALPDDEAKPPAGVLLLAAEDDPSVVLRPRFEANGANLDLVRIYDQGMLLDGEGLKKLEMEIIEYSMSLIVIDPIVSFLGRMIDTSKAADVRSVMGPLHNLAKKHSCAIVVVRHWNKSSMATASQRGSGSVDFRNAARSVLQVIQANDEHFVTLEKSNYAATGKTLKFALQNKAVLWTGTCDLSADDLIREQQNGSQESRSDLSEAVAFLEDELRNGPVESAKIQKAATELGISGATLKRARAKLKAVAKKLPGKNCYFTYLPTQIPAAPDQAHEDQVHVCDELEPHPLFDVEYAS